MNLKKSHLNNFKKGFSNFPPFPKGGRGDSDENILNPPTIPFTKGGLRCVAIITALVSMTILLFSFTTLFAAAGDLKWKYKVGGDWVDSPPAVGSDGTIYVGSYSNCKLDSLYAINSNGTTKWKFTNQGFSIPYSQAIGSDGTTYVVTRHDAKLFAFNSDGTLKWLYNASPGGYLNAGSPAIGSDGTVYHVLFSRMS